MIVGPPTAWTVACAVRLATEGADIACFDVPAWRASSEVELELSVLADSVRAAGRQLVTAVLDSDDKDEIAAAAAAARRELGRLDVVCPPTAPAVGGSGICKLDVSDWRSVLEAAMTRPWLVACASLETLLGQNLGGSIVFTSASSEKIRYEIDQRIAVGHSVVNVMRSLAGECGPHRIRVNAVLRSLPPDASYPMTRQMDAFSGAIAYFAAPQSRYVTGTVISV